MKAPNYRTTILAFGGILIATFAAGCYGGGGSGYYGGSNGYNSSYSSYGSSYPYSGYNGGYAYPRSYGNSYNNGYQNGVRADANRDQHDYHAGDQHAALVDRNRAVARTETTHTTVDRTEKN